MFAGFFPSEISKMTLLQQLVLSENTISGTLPTGLANLNMLTVLEINDNSFFGTPHSSKSRHIPY
jgi:Leucine-rich repeat (LRR) protein